MSPYFSLGIGIFLAIINLILGIVSLSYFRPKQDRESNSFVLVLPWIDFCTQAVVFGIICFNVLLSLSHFSSLCYLCVLHTHSFLTSRAHVSLTISSSLQRAKEEITDRHPSYLDTGYAIGVVLLFISKLNSQILHCLVTQSVTSNPKSLGLH